MRLGRNEWVAAMIFILAQFFGSFIVFSTLHLSFSGLPRFAQIGICGADAIMLAAVLSTLAMKRSPAA